MRRPGARSLALALTLASSLVTLRAARAAEASDAPWVAGSPDTMIERAGRRAAAGGDDALARLLLIESLGDEATAGRARAELDALARRSDPLGETAR